MANDPEHSEIIATVVDVTMLEVVAEPDKKSSDAATGSAVEEADEEHGKMEGVAESPRVRRKMKEVIIEPADRMKDAATRSPMKQEKSESREVVIQISEGFNLRIAEEINSYCANQLRPRNVDRGHEGSGFYRVPEDMRRRQREERLYDPTYINFSKVREMLENKYPDVETRNLRNHYYYHFFRIQQVDEGKDEGKELKDYLDMMSMNREKIAKCYGKKEVDVDFPQLFGLLLSSCFVVYLLFTPYFYFSEECCECCQRWVNDLWVDLLLLENQIPFFILERVLDKVQGELFALEQYTFRYFRDIVPLKGIDEKFKESVHLLDFIHRRLLPAKQSDHRSFFTKLSSYYCFTNLPIFLCFFTEMSLHFCCPARWKYYILRLQYRLRSRKRLVRRVIPTATRLQQAGIQFRAVERKGFVVEFKRGVLRLPRLHIQKNTKKFFLNLIAWEQCHQPAVKYVINFAILMDHLINTSKDVEILIHNNVLENSLANEEEVATMFNSLGKDLIHTKNEIDNREYDFFIQLCTELNEHCTRSTNIWRTDLKMKYFSNPWTILSLIAALLLILLTLEQAFFSAFSYFRPPK